MTRKPYPEQIRPRDRIVFFGDSITEQQLYTNYVETYLVTRYPELELTFFNAGWSGDTAPVALERIERDVLSLKPTLVTVCFGMNDGAYLGPNEEIRGTFLSAMTGIVERLRGAGARVVLLTPGFVDETVNPFLGGMDYNKGTLRALADAVIGLARREKLPWFDLHALMNDVDRRGKKKDPSFCLAPDSVHPNPAGHLVMAYGLLKALGVPPRDDLVEVDLGTGRAAASPGLGARSVNEAEDGRIRVDLTLSGIPFFVDPAARPVLPFLPFLETYSRLRLRVTGAQQRYFVRLQKHRLGWTSPAKLAQGMEIMDTWHTEAMKDAARVQAYTNEKDQVYYKTWRLLALRGGKGPGYDRAVHRLGIRGSEALEQSRAALVAGLPLTFSVTFDQPQSKGESLGNGEFILYWSLRGPFMGREPKDHLDGEAAASTKLPARSAGWVRFEAPVEDLPNCLVNYYGRLENCCAYAVTVIYSPGEQRCDLMLGSDDGYAVWLNGALVEERLDLSRSAQADQNRMSIILRRGKNILLIRINQIMGGWGFCVRFAGLAKPVSVAFLP